MTGVSDLRINSARLMGDLESLAAIGRASEGGIHRAAFSDAYRQAVDWLIDRMQAAGMETRIDAVGNVIGRMGPADGAVIMTGSHIDTVRNGGPLDGALGVLAGIEVARVLSENKVVLGAPYEVVAFNDEEGAFLSLMGAMALSGTIRDEDLQSAANAEGVRLIDAMRESGLDPDRYHQAAYPAESIAKYLELHIEQGPVLENLDLEIGVVDGIVCQRNIEYTFRGQSNHAGTTPMNMRRDTFRAAAEFVTHSYALLDQGYANESTRMTFGTCAIAPGYSNVIPRETTVRLDNRDLDESSSARLVERVAQIAVETADKYNVEIDINERCTNPAALMDGGLIESLQAVARDLGYSHQVMPSGAGHDAQAMALICKAGMIFVPSRRGLSHHPDEWTAPELLAKGVNVLLQALLRELS
ncbi:Zn-dependent hydrolase [Microbulbifer marinus]|uniref:N-carbamoyl-L-amino-acid hydrolase n=1 Tax=Microbulbifer marinus TaxID=658218 RepID=A0A1H4B401_9GAMM|nr:Zn-dependent hydrolase [Microbulbifer marinus]SEA42915.1 N-carbamoyl-L-amino-acid hydrolase [Microbulbifer marinus]